MNLDPVCTRVGIRVDRKMKDQTVVSKQPARASSGAAQSAKSATAKATRQDGLTEEQEAKKRKDRAALAAFYILFGSLLLALIYFIGVMFLM